MLWIWIRKNIGRLDMDPGGQYSTKIEKMDVLDVLF
jgi:hypothetical protein